MTELDLTLDLVAHLNAEPHVLAEWGRDTRHPRLADAYRALVQRVAGRSRAVAEATIAARPEARTPLLERTLQVHGTATATAFELSRLKWLRANRQARLTHEALPGYETHRAAEAEETEALDRLLAELSRGMC